MSNKLIIIQFKVVGHFQIQELNWILGVILISILNCAQACAALWRKVWQCETTLTAAVAIVSSKVQLDYCVSLAADCCTSRCWNPF